MRSLLLSLAMVGGSLGLTALMPSQAHAQWYPGGYSSYYYGPVYPGPVYGGPVYYGPTHYPGYAYYYGPTYYTPPYYWSGRYAVTPYGRAYTYQRYDPWSNRYYYRWGARPGRWY